MVGTQKAEEAVVLRVARNIGERRRALGLTQAQLAERLGVDTETLSRFERGKHAPTLRNLIRLAGLLQTTVADLLVEDKQQPSEDATIMTAWLAVLTPEDRVFAMSMLKRSCEHLAAIRSVPCEQGVNQASVVAQPSTRQQLAQPESDAVGEAETQPLKKKLQIKPPRITPALRKERVQAPLIATLEEVDDLRDDAEDRFGE